MIYAQSRDRYYLSRNKVTDRQPYTTRRYLAHLLVEWVCNQSGEQGHGTPLFLIWTFVGRFQHRNQRLHRAFTVQDQFVPTHRTIYINILKNNDYRFFLNTHIKDQHTRELVSARNTKQQRPESPTVLSFGMRV